MSKVLVVGVSGMLGSAVYRLLSSSEGFSVTGTARSSTSLAALPRNDNARIVSGVEVMETDRLVRLFMEEHPDVVINCVGIIKQLSAAKDPLTSIAINSLLPHRLAELCELAGARLVQISTDCVFNGSRGGYREADFPDADDLYGRTKLLGEVDYPHAITLRTSIIGHEIGSAVSLVDWFLSQPGPVVKGYRKAIYTGLPTVELARVIRDFVIPQPQMCGLWQVASDPINKFDLLQLIAKTYGKSIEIVPDDAVAIDRSLDGSRFREEAGYIAPAWPELVARMHAAR
uniref:dTDP-4-dehydrorhamnose reductase n=1 Tax=Bosea sp. NBC_00436 TaxID=2969620 RepID=A0A9E7ZV88_9HYPH